MSDEMDHTPVQSYATRGMRLWQARQGGHGEVCGCLSCADARAYLKRPALTPPMAPEQRKERAS